METFDTLDELWLNIASRSLKGGLLGFSARLQNPKANFMFNPGRKMDAICAATTLIEYVTEKPLLEIIGILKNTDEAYQGILTLWHGYCLQLIRRDSKLYLISLLPFSNIWLSLPYDIFYITSVQILVAEALSCDVGWSQFVIGSSFLDKVDLKGVDKALSVSFNTDEMLYEKHCMPVPATCKVAGKALAWNHHHTCCTLPPLESLGVNSYMSQMLCMAASGWSKNASKLIFNPIMRKYL